MTTQNPKPNNLAGSMGELMARAGGSLQILQKGQQVSGTIKKLTAQEILMDIGAKGDALVIEYDRQNLENLLSMLKVGDQVLATVISPESEEGFPVVSLRRTLDDIIYHRFEELSKHDEAFEVLVAEATRGGYFCETPEGVRGFLPTSQVLPEDNIIGKKIMVKILELDRAKKRVVFSQKATVYVTNQAIIRKYIRPDMIVEGTITQVTPYGLFVAIKIDGNDKNLPARRQVEGFVHISEVSYERVESLVSEFVVGQKLKTQVLDRDLMNKRVNLSIKRTQKDKFQEAKTQYKPEEKIKGKVKNVQSRGVTIEIGEGILGLIPSDKIPSGVTYKVGEEIEAEVVEVDERRRVVILSPILKAVPIGYR